MNGERIRPRFELEDESVGRLAAHEALPDAEALPPTGATTAAMVAAGVLLVTVGFSALSAANFVALEFGRSAILGMTTLAIGVGGAGLLAAACVRELRGLFRLRRVDSLRARLEDPATRREAALEWLDTLPEGPALRPAVAALNDPDSILPLLRAGPGADLRARAQAAGRAAALQVFGLTAAVPSPALDGLVIAWRGARLIREVAMLHGMRPGILGSLALLRRTAWAAAHATAANFAADAVVRAAVSHPLLAHVAGDIAGAGVAARRMITLARAADVACSPLPPD